MQAAWSLDSQRPAPPCCDSVGHYRRLRESSFSSVTVLSVCLVLGLLLLWGFFFFRLLRDFTPLPSFFGSICITLRYACVATNESPVRRSEAACQHNFPPRSPTRGNLSHTNWEQRRYAQKKKTPDTAVRLKTAATSERFPVAFWSAARAKLSGEKVFILQIDSEV